MPLPAARVIICALRLLFGVSFAIEKPDYSIARVSRIHVVKLTAIARSATELDRSALAPKTFAEATSFG
jgi:hypothetical protein